MSLTRKELHCLVQDDVMTDLLYKTLKKVLEEHTSKWCWVPPTLITPNQLLSSRNWLPAWLNYAIEKLQKEEKNEISNKILTALKCPIVNLQEGVDYFGEVRDNKGKWKADGQLKIKWEKINMILLSQYFAGDFVIEIYRRCYERTFASYRKHVEAGRGHEQEKRLYLNQSAICRRALSRDIATAGVNPRFGIMTCF